MNAEKWLPVVGYEGSYEVSDQGRVRSIDRTIYSADGRSWAQSGKILAAHVDWTSNPPRRRVILSAQSNQVSRTVSRLVLEAFVGLRPENEECCHGLGGSTDDRLKNLRWGTSSANSYDTVRDGNHHYARRTHCKHGHEFTLENTMIRSDGGRRCRICKRDIQRRAAA